MTTETVKRSSKSGRSSLPDAKKKKPHSVYMREDLRDFLYGIDSVIGVAIEKLARQNGFNPSQDQ